MHWTDKIIYYTRSICNARDIDVLDVNYQYLSKIRYLHIAIIFFS